MKSLSKQFVSILVAGSLIGCNAFKQRADQAIKSTTQTPQQKVDELNESDELYQTYEVKAEPKKGVADKIKSQISVPASTRQAVGAPASKVMSKEMAIGSVATQGIRSGGASFLPQSDSVYYPYYPQQNTESYDAINENGFHECTADPLSTFSIDVDTAAYSNIRRFISQGQTPPADAVRIEEMINYFDYDYAQPESGAFAVNMEMAEALWNKKHKLVRIGIKGKEMKTDKRPASNLVFLIDVSGSMESPEKLPLVKSSLAMLVDKLGESDKISMIVYAGAAGMVLSPTTGDKKHQILRAIDNLHAGGSTNGGQGIELAYKTASEQFIKGGVNRVILATDGDFNVGVTDRDGLLGIVEKNAKKNIYISILGYGMGNYKDGMMETLSNKGNGNYSYIDTQQEARKVMVEQMSGTLVTIAKDVKLQVEFNPKFVQSYRLVGYENRVLKNEDFNNDQKDAGDIGAGHTVTALYEIVPVGATEPTPAVDGLKYQKVIKEEKVSVVNTTSDNNSNELLTLKIRYKKPDGDVSAKQEFPLVAKEKSFESASESFRFASSVALFGMLLRSSQHAKEGTYKDVIAAANAAKGSDKNGYRAEFVDLVKKVNGSLSNRQARIEE